MGEIAEMMLDGTLCEACGVFIGSDAGFPQYCSKQCADDRGAEWHGKAKRSKNWKPSKATATEPDEKDVMALNAAFMSYLNCAAKRKFDPAELIAVTVAALADAFDGASADDFRKLCEDGMKISMAYGEPEDAA